MALTTEHTTAGNSAGVPPPLGDDLRRAREEARTLGYEAGAVVGELRELGRLELELARAEAQDSISAARQAAIFGAVAGAMGLVMVAFLALAGTLALDLVLEGWAAALIVSGVLLLLALIAGLAARSRMQQVHLMPTQTIDSVKEDVRWARERMMRNGA